MKDILKIKFHVLFVKNRGGQTPASLSFKKLDSNLIDAKKFELCSKTSVILQADNKD